jgi:hypothetical protein
MGRIEVKAGKNEENGTKTFDFQQKKGNNTYRTEECSHFEKMLLLLDYF